MPSKFLIPLIGLFVLNPRIPSEAALFLGISLALLFGNPYATQTKTIVTWLLGICITALGASVDFGVIAKFGLAGLAATFLSIVLTLLLGFLIGRWLKVDREISLLISSGTAICGGSAIAAVGSTIRAKGENLSVSLGVVFILNSIALFLFPTLGHFFQLTQTQFGLFTAFAIHDTSSVVGSALQYGDQALEIATTVKLTRALWIVPLAIAIGSFLNQTQESKRPKIPWFIFGFVITALIFTSFPILKPLGKDIAFVAKRCFVLTLFLIGCGLSRSALKSVGIKPFLQGMLLWIIVSASTLAVVSMVD